MYFILDKDKNVISATLEEWAAFFEDFDNKRIVSTEIGGVRVSTVFLGLDAGNRGGAPLVFETMIFGGPCDELCWRYSEYHSALMDHYRICNEIVFVNAALNVE